MALSPSPAAPTRLFAGIPERPWTLSPTGTRPLGPGRAGRVACLTVRGWAGATAGGGVALVLVTRRLDRGVRTHTCVCVCVCVDTCVCSGEEADLSPKFRSREVSLGRRTKTSPLTQRCRSTQKAETQTRRPDVGHPDPRQGT